MEDIVLHAGAEHPDLLWIVVPALLSFVIGLVIGIASYTGRLRTWLGSDDPSAD